MAQVTVTLNGRTYQLECDSGEEEHVLALAEQLSEYVVSIAGELGELGDERLLLMAALMVADDLAAAQNQITELNAKVAELRRDVALANETATSAHTDVADKLADATDRIRAISGRLSRPPANDDSA